MIAATAFNMLANAVMSFGAGLAIVWLALSVSRIADGRLRLYLLSLPFLKIVYDTSRWIPSDSYLWTGGDPLSKLNKMWLSVSLGLNDFGPFLGAGLRVIDPSGSHFSLSFGDFARSWIAKTTAPELPTHLVATIASISILLTIRRLAAYLIHAAEWRRAVRRGSARLLLESRVGRRKVGVYLQDSKDSNAHAGGILRPYIALSHRLFSRLSPEERAATLAHELAHVRGFDLPQALMIALLGDIFWFVPGYRQLQRRLEDQRELAADQAAVREGADPLALATTLLKTRADAEARDHRGLLPAIPSVYSGLAKHRPLLRRRIEHLTASSVGQANVGGQALLATLATAAVLASSIGGNYELGGHDEFSRHIAAQLARFLGWGWATF